MKIVVKNSIKHLKLNESLRYYLPYHKVGSESNTLRELRKKCPYSELFWSVFSRTWTQYSISLRTQSKYRKIRTRITQWRCPESIGTSMEVIITEVIKRTYKNPLNVIISKITKIIELITKLQDLT